MSANQDDLLIGVSCRQYSPDLRLRVEGPCSGPLHGGMYVASLWSGMVLIGWNAWFTATGARETVEQQYAAIITPKGGWK
jgi:hypothetical protein